MPRLAGLTEGYSCSDLAALTREAAMGPVRGLRPEDLISATPDKAKLGGGTQQVPLDFSSFWVI